VNTKWQVIYYVSSSGNNPVKDFLDSADSKRKTKALRLLFHIEEYGLQAVIPHIKKLSGLPLWEIRMLGQDSIRILFVTRISSRVVLLHAFFKKTQKTPGKEIAIALARLKELASKA
jgi:phage-related protein